MGFFNAKGLFDCSNLCGTGRYKENSDFFGFQPCFLNRFYSRESPCLVNGGGNGNYIIHKVGETNPYKSYHRGTGGGNQRFYPRIFRHINSCGFGDKFRRFGNFKYAVESQRGQSIEDYIDIVKIVELTV